MVTGMALERITVPLPGGFDPSRHVPALPKLLAKLGKGEGWSVESVNLGEGTFTSTRQAQITEVKSSDQKKNGALEVNLPTGTKPADGDRFAAKMADAYPGYHLVKFEPFTGKATLATLSEAELRARGAVAVALGCKPWDVMVQARRDGGFSFQLPASYVPSKHDTKLQEAAETAIGRFGWYFTVDPKTLVAQVIPSDPPTFPAVVPFPFDTVRPVTDFSPKGDKDRFTLNLALGLGAPGEKNTPVPMSLDDSTAVLVVGLPGSGKSVAVQSIVYQAIVKGYRIACINTNAKKTDFAWLKPYVQDHWWGCDDIGTSVAEALTVATLVDEEGKRLGELLDKHKVGKWQELPESVKKANPPVLLVADELAALLNKPTLPAGLSKEAKGLPQFVQMAQDYLEAKLLTLRLNGIVAVHRAAGIRELYLSQRPSQTEGFPPSLKNLIPHRVLLGPSPSEADLSMAFRDARRINRLPVNVASDPIASRGAGIAHLDGTDPVVMKGFYASNADFELHLRKHLGAGDPSDKRVRPSAAQIEKYVPRADGEGGLDDDPPPAPVRAGERMPSGRPASELDPKFGPVKSFDADGNVLKGAAAAAAGGKKIKDEAAKAGPPCPDCGDPIQADGGCGCA